MKAQLTDGRTVAAPAQIRYGMVHPGVPMSEQHPAETVDALRDELEMAWAIIANAGGGDWQKESTEWQDAAAKWRDRYHALIRPEHIEKRC